MMATSTAPINGTQAAVLPGRRYDHYFFSSIAALMLGLVVAGFGPSYYFAGVFRSPLPSTIIHVHGAVFSCWMLLLIVQTSLVGMGRADIHKRLGMVGMIMVAVMLVLGVLAATDSLARPARMPGRDPLAFYLIPLVSVAAFAALMYFAFRQRRNSPAHKRFILVSNVALMTAAIARLPFEFVHRKAPADMLCGYAFILLLVAYDLWSTGKLQRATLGAAAFLVTTQWAAVLFSHTSVWHAFAGSVQTWARAHLI
jgi:hypothetical protein